MSIIGGIQKYLNSCPLLDSFTGGSHIDWTDQKPENYGIMPSGETIVKRFITGKTINQYNFSVYFCSKTLGEFSRVQNSEFMEDFTNWVFQKNLKGDFPDLGEFAEPIELSCENAMLFDFDNSAKTGTYQVQLHLIYRRI